MITKLEVILTEEEIKEHVPHFDKASKQNQADLVAKVGTALGLDYSTGGWSWRASWPKIGGGVKLTGRLVGSGSVIE